MFHISPNIFYYVDDWCNFLLDLYLFRNKKLAYQIEILQFFEN